MSKQSIFRRPATVLRCAAQRQRPLSTAVVAALPQQSLYGRSSYHTQATNTTTTTNWARRDSRAGGLQVRWFSSDSSGDDDEGKKKKKNKKAKKEEGEEPAAPVTEEEKKEPPPKDDKEECPPWQNPLHHNNPENEKVFAEDHAPGEEMIPMDLPPLADPNDPDKILASQEVYDLADEIVNLSMLEMKELVTKIGNHFDFQQPPFTGPGGGGAGGGGGDDDDESAAAPAVEKKAFDLKLVTFDAKSKIKVIKEVRAIAGLGLKEAKELVEGVPKVVMKDINKEMAEELQKKLEEVGATVEIV